uniref:Uncharacterized protein n=1 Tax=Solanum lycopersicum TaxID=4081 RepID=A0A3Q7F2Y5_SOLLC
MLLYSASAELFDMVVCFFDFQFTKEAKILRCGNDKLLLNNSRYSRCLESPNELGIWPLNLLSLRNKSIRFEELEIELGITPPMLFSARFKSTRFVRQISKSGRREYLASCFPQDSRVQASPSSQSLFRAVGQTRWNVTTQVVGNDCNALDFLKMAAYIYRKSPC